LHEELRTDLEFLAKRAAKYANKKRLAGLTLQEEDPVYLIRKNIKIKRLSSKLDHTKLSLFKIKKKLGAVTYRL